MGSKICNHFSKFLRVILILWQQKFEEYSVCSRIFWIRSIFVVDNIFRKLFRFFFLNISYFWGEEGLPCKSLLYAVPLYSSQKSPIILRVSRMHGMLRNGCKINLQFFCLPKNIVSAFILFYYVSFFHIRRTNVEWIAARRRVPLSTEWS